MNRGAGHEDGALERVGGLAVESIGDGGQQSVLRANRIRPGIHYRKATGSIGALHHAGLKARLADGCSLLIARYTPSRRRGLAYGIRGGIAIVAAPLGVQMVAWLFSDQAGFDRLFYALAGIVLVILLAAGFLPSSRAQAGQTVGETS